MNNFYPQEYHDSTVKKLILDIVNEENKNLVERGKVVVLPESFTDETNSTKVLDDSMIYIIPESSNGKPVKIAMEGETIIDEFSNYDRSKEIQAYKKFGVALIVDNDMATYKVLGE